jgi:hypothetical protein
VINPRNSANTVSDRLVDFGAFMAASGKQNDSIPLITRSARPVMDKKSMRIPGQRNKAVTAIERGSA